MEKQKSIELLRQMIKIRAFEETMSDMYARAEAAGGTHLSIGQEAVAVGVCSNLRTDDFVASNHRGHHHCIAKGGDVNLMMAELFAKKTGYCKGKGGSMHIIAPEIGFMAAAIVGSTIPIAVGAALSAKVNHTDRVAVAFFGDGSSNQGYFHESLNFAALFNLPVIFVCENNGYAFTVSQKRHQAISDIACRAAGYNMPGITIDGNDVLCVYNTAREAIERARSGKGPMLIECKTYRMKGHYQGDPGHGVSYRTKEEMNSWQEKCPITNYSKYLLEQKIVNESDIEQIRQEMAALLKDAVEYARQSPVAESYELFTDVFADRDNSVFALPSPTTRKISMRAAINEAMKQALSKDPTVLMFGEDVGVFEGFYKTAVGLMKDFGEERVFDTPIAEVILANVGLGAAITGTKPIIDYGQTDFMLLGADGVINSVAKTRYMSGGHLTIPMVIRAAQGAVGGGAAQHSQSLHGLFMGVPGLKIACPSTAYDAKGLLLSAINDNNPVIFVEDRALYREKGEVPETYYEVPFGQAAIRRQGKDVTIIATMSMVGKALRVANQLSTDGIDIEVIDPRTICPLDKDTIINSVKKTGKCIVVDEGCYSNNFASEIASLLNEFAFEYLQAPVVKVAAPMVPVPYSRQLELLYVPSEKNILEAVRKVTVF